MARTTVALLAGLLGLASSTSASTPFMATAEAHEGTAEASTNQSPKELPREIRLLPAGPRIESSWPRDFHIAQLPKPLGERASAPQALLGVAEGGELDAANTLAEGDPPSPLDSPELEEVDSGTDSDAPESDDEEDAEEDGEEEDEEDAVETILGECWHQVGPISIEYLYTGEVFTNTRGGISTKDATRYRGNFDLTMSLDTEAACWWEGGTFFVYMQQDHGRTLTQKHVGDGQFYSNIDTGSPQDVTQLAEYWYQHTWGEDIFSMKIGRQDANENFAYADLGGDFINSSFVTMPNVPLPTWPYQTMALSSLYQYSPEVRLGGGMYDHGRDVGQWWSTYDNRGMFYIGQLDYQPWASCEEAPLAILRVGSWYTNSDTVTVDAGSVYEGNYGFYTTVDRMLLPEPGDCSQGLGAFAQYCWAPGDRNWVDIGYSGGLVYRGPIQCRDEDTMGVGFTVIEFSSDARAATGQTYENAIEVFYKARLRGGFAIQPDLQYIVQPSGIERDALVVGLRFEANF
ncbi:MAG: carbohydrate porin [Pirellulales bacterium]|nr:carbohydrate porin [Pirellulales bacterium]